MSEAGWAVGKMDKGDQRYKLPDKIVMGYNIQYGDCSTVNYTVLYI